MLNRRHIRVKVMHSLHAYLQSKSDNIPGIFTKCGIKTAEKYYDNKELFNEKLKKENKEFVDLLKLHGEKKGIL